MNHAERLDRFYAFYAPAKRSLAAYTLKLYQGKEGVLFATLEKKYGPESTIPLNFVPTPLPTISASSSSQQTTDRDGMSGPYSSTSVDGSKPVRSSSAAASTTRRVGFATDAFPSPSPTRRGGNTQPRRGAGASAVEYREPILEQRAVSDPLTREMKSLRPLHFEGYRARLERFYRHYAPDKLSNVEAALQAYEGREDIMFRVLEKKYGPEPRAFVAVKTEEEPGSSSTSAVQTAAEDGDGSRPMRMPNPSVVGTQAGPDPKTLVFHTPYDYEAALKTVGIRSDVIPQLLLLYGEDRTAYAASILLLVNLIGHDSLFDGDVDRTLVFPFHRLQEVKKSRPDMLDLLAFEHITAYRTLYIEAVQHMISLRNLEALSRSSMLQYFSDVLGQREYHAMVLQEAIKQIEPIEEERRTVIKQDELLRRDGMVLWFRNRRRELINGFPVSSDNNEHHSTESHDDHEEDGDEGGLALSPTLVSLSPNAVPGSVRYVTLEESEQRLQHIHAKIRSRSACIPKWSDSSASPRVASQQPADPSSWTSRRSHSAPRSESPSSSSPYHPQNSSSRQRGHPSSSTAQQGPSGGKVETPSSKTCWVPNSPCTAKSHRRDPTQKDGGGNGTSARSHSHRLKDSETQSLCSEAKSAATTSRLSSATTTNNGVHVRMTRIPPRGVFSSLQVSVSPFMRRTEKEASV